MRQMISEIVLMMARRGAHALRPRATG
jgi:hypothetical protein